MSLTTAIEFEEFLPEVAPYVRDCPDNAMLNAIRNATIEFCRDSTWLRDTPSVGITIVAGTSEYELDVPSYYEVATITEANIGNLSLAPSNAETLGQIYGPAWRTLQGQSAHYVIEQPKNIRLALVPNQAQTDTLTYTVALMPKRSASRVDKQLYERWAEVIAHGARARLYDTPAQPYYDVESAKRFRKWFEDGIGEAKIEANRGRSRSVLYVRPPRIT